MFEVSIINMGVCLFKYQKWNEAIKVWSQIENKTQTNERKPSSITASEAEEQAWSEKCNFPITLLFNISLAHFLKRNYDTAIDLCQELI